MSGMIAASPTSPRAGDPERWPFLSKEPLPGDLCSAAWLRTVAAKGMCGLELLPSPSPEPEVSVVIQWERIWHAWQRVEPKGREYGMHGKG